MNCVRTECVHLSEIMFAATTWVAFNFRKKKRKRK